MQPPAPAPRATVANIQLTEFSYESDYDFQNLDDVDLNVNVMKRLAPISTQNAADRFDVLVQITYSDQRTAVAVLKAACLTSYTVHGIAASTDPQSGERTLEIPNSLLALMRIEAVAHARALVAGQAAATPFGKTYALTPPFKLSAADGG